MRGPDIDIEAVLMDPDASWWAKCRRADQHQLALSTLIEEFKNSRPYELFGEPTDQQDLRAFRLHVLREPPTEIALVVGDLLHNLRSALDSLAVGLLDMVERTELTEEHERATTFPIGKTPEAFRDFFEPAKGRHSSLRAKLYSERAKQAFRVVQPFWFGEQFAIPSDRTRDEVYAEDLEMSPLYRLHRLNNVDKHRRLHLTALWPGLMAHPAGTVMRIGDGFSDGDIVGYLEGPGAADGSLCVDFAITLLEETLQGRYEFTTPFRPMSPGLADCLVLTNFLATATRSSITQVINEYKRLGSGLP